MTQINATPQLPAVTPVNVPADRSTPLTQVPADESSASSTSSQIEAKPMNSGSAAARAEARWFTRPSRVIVAVAAAVALFFGGGVVGSVVTRVSAPSTVDASAAALTDIMAASDAQRASAPIESGGVATLVWSNTLGLSAVLIDGLPELPTGKVYEAWYIDESGSVASAGTFATAEAGITWHVLDGSMAAGDAVGLTVEPTGGSEQPTTDPILVMQSS